MYSNVPLLKIILVVNGSLLFNCKKLLIQFVVHRVLPHLPLARNRFRNSQFLQPGSVPLASSQVHSAPVSCYEPYLESAPVLPDDLQIEFARVLIYDFLGQAAKIFAPQSQEPQVYLGDPQ